MKKGLCILLIFVMCISCCKEINYAGEITETFALYVTYSDTGIMLVDEKTDEGEKKIGAEKTIYDDVYMTEAEKLIIKVSDDMFQEVEQYNVLLDSCDGVKKKLKTIQIDEEIKNEVIDMCNYQIALGNYVSEAVIFVPSISDTKATSNSSYTYSGHVMKDVATYYLNLETSTKVVSKGSAAKGFASALTEVAITATGFASKWVSLFSGGVSALTAYCNASGCTASQIPAADPTNYNRLEAYVNYNVYTKRTYEKVDGEYELGLISQRYIINRIVTKEHFLINDTYGSTEILTKVLGVNTSGDKKTSHFANPASFAILWTGNHYDERFAQVNVEYKKVNISLTQ